MSTSLAIIVYGKYLGSLSVINVLLDSNIDGRRIVYVEPGDRANLPFIDSATVSVIGNADLRNLNKKNLP